MAELVLSPMQRNRTLPSGEHLVIDKGSPIYNEIDTKKLEQSPPDFTVTLTER